MWTMATVNMPPIGVISIFVCIMYTVKEWSGIPNPSPRFPMSTIICVSSGREVSLMLAYSATDYIVASLLVRSKINASVA